MKKYTFLVFHKEYIHFLDSLREQGVLHVKDRGAVDMESNAQREILTLLNRVQESIKFLEKKINPEIQAAHVLEKQINIAAKVSMKPMEDGVYLLAAVDKLRLRQESLIQSMGTLEKEALSIEPWGVFNWETIDRLEKAGWSVQLYSVSEKRWKEEWESEFNAFKIGKNGPNILFVTVVPKNTEFEIEADKIKLPHKHFDAVLTEIEQLQEERQAIEHELGQFAAANLSQMLIFKNHLQQEFDFGKVVLNTGKAVEEKISILEGYVPVDKEPAFESFLAKEQVYYEASRPELSDKVPVLLKNNWFARLFEPIGELYTLPNYHELDLTALYAPFYWLFFGFCLGDLGYGLILFLGGYFMSGRVKPAMKGGMKLLSFLGLSTMLFGLLSGTCFGMNLFEMRLGFYANLDDLLKSKDTSINKILFNLSLVLGAIQILYGMFVKAANEIYQSGWRYALSTLGWIFIILGFALNYSMKKFGVDPFTVTLVFSMIMVIGFLGAFVFNSPERNIITNMAMGLWDTYNMATGLMGDILSYIRLFALAISTGILGYVFNSLAISMAPDIPVVKYIVILLILGIGHTINLLMGILGSFVHPMRLTFVEFYKNAGFSGGGKKYSPFKNKME